jgi:DNA polymerase-1
MLKAIADGLDFHSFSASAMKKIPYDEIIGVLADKSHPKFKEYKDLRQLSKVLTFSLLYGSSVAGIALQLNLTKEAAQVLMDMYFKAFPKVKDYIERSHKFALWNQMSLTPLGQRRRQYGTYPCFKPTAAYNASMRGSQNMIIQSTTSTIGLATFTELNRRVKLLGAKCICTVYDSVEIECSLEKAAEVINLAYDVMDNYPLEAFKFMELPIGSEGDVGISWGETEVVHKGVTQSEIDLIVSKIREKSFTSFGGPIYN